MKRAVLGLLVACSSSSSDPVTGDAPPPGGIIDGPVGEWRWYDIPGAICANGSPTGLGVNQGAGDTVLIYMASGSACLDENCTIGTPSMRKDGGFAAPQLAACVAGDCDGNVTFPTTSIFDRTPGASPFTDATYVFISNCAGDYYVGDADHAFPSWTAHFRGRRNQALFAAEVAASFPRAGRVVLSGGSAGSVGALLNYWQWVKAFPATRVDLISDSFALVFEDGPEYRYDLHGPLAPDGCDTCNSDYRSIYEFNARIAQPGARLAILDSENNITLDLVSGMYTEGLAALQPRIDALPNTKYFVANGNVHILMKYPLTSALTDVNGMHDVAEFLGKMQGDDPTWQSYSALP